VRCVRTTSVDFICKNEHMISSIKKMTIIKDHYKVKIYDVIKICTACIFENEISNRQFL